MNSVSRNSAIHSYESEFQIEFNMRLSRQPYVRVWKCMVVMPICPSLFLPCDQHISYPEMKTPQSWQYASSSQASHPNKLLRDFTTLDLCLFLLTRSNEGCSSCKVLIIHIRPHIKPKGQFLRLGLLTVCSDNMIDVMTKAQTLFLHCITLWPPQDGIQ